MHPLVRTFTAAVVALACGSTSALQLAYEPTSLGWTPAEVQLAGKDSLENALGRATRLGKLGCQQFCARLERVFAGLVVQAREQTERARTLPWSLTVLRLDDVDAFALPEGQVVLAERLIEDRGLSDEALAFVLAHEMAHSILEHERQALTFGRLLLPRQVERSVQDMYTELQHNAGLRGALEPVWQQGEFEADELGLLLAALAGYAPNRQLEFMQNEVAESQPRRSMVSTHPSAQERLQRLEARLPLAWRLYEAAQARARGADRF